MLSNFTSSVIPDLVGNILLNLISNFIFVAVSYLFLLWIYLGNRKEALSFFGVESPKPDIYIYLSNLNVEKSTGIEEVREGYKGPATTKLEYEAALLIQRQLRPRPLPILPKSWQEWLGQKNMRLKTIEAEIRLSPSHKITYEDDALNNNLVVLGTGIYNSISHFYLWDYLQDNLDKHANSFYTSKNEKGVRIIGLSKYGVQRSSLEKGRDEGVEQAFIHKFFDEHHNISVILCAGSGNSATFGAARHLAENWQRIQEEAHEEFGMALWFNEQSPDGDFVKKPDRVSYMWGEKGRKFISNRKKIR